MPRQNSRKKVAITVPHSEEQLLVFANAASKGALFASIGGEHFTSLMATESPSINDEIMKIEVIKKANCLN